MYPFSLNILLSKQLRDRQDGPDPFVTRRRFLAWTTCFGAEVNCKARRSAYWHIIDIHRIDFESRGSSYRSLLLPVDVLCHQYLYICRSSNFAHQIFGTHFVWIRSPRYFEDKSGHFRGHDPGTYKSCGVTWTNLKHPHFRRKCKRSDRLP